MAITKENAERGSATMNGYQNVGPNLIIDGPPAPGSYPTTPDRSLVRTADPRIEDPTIPTPQYKFVDAVDAKPRLLAAENGTGIL